VLASVSSGFRLRIEKSKGIRESGGELLNCMVRWINEFNAFNICNVLHETNLVLHCHEGNKSTMMEVD